MADIEKDDPEAAEPKAKAKPVDDPEGAEVVENTAEAAGDEEADADEGAEAKGEQAAHRVAEALGVEDEGASEADAEAAAALEAESAPNRAARRRDEARRRRKKTAAATTVEDDDVPRDKNKRAKDLLTKRREQAAGGPRPVNLLPSEMVDDALARSANATWKWVRQNSTTIQFVLIAAVVTGIGFSVYRWRSDKGAANASDDLANAVADERGLVMPEDKRPDEQKEIDPSHVFKTAEERNDTALASFKKVEDSHPNTGAAILAKLGEAGISLDKHDWPKALELYAAVASSTLAGADPDVKGRSLEGMGLAKEGKGDLDGAITTFKELETVDARGFKELAQYQQGRVLLKKGEKDAAKDLLKKVFESLKGPSEEGRTFYYLESMVGETLRQIDPGLAPAKGSFGGPKGGTMSSEEAKKYLQKLQEASQQKGEEHHH